MKILKNEKGMTIYHLVIVIGCIMIIAAFSIVLLLGDDGFSFRTSPYKTEENVNSTKKENKEETNKTEDNTVYR